MHDWKGSDSYPEHIKWIFMNLLQIQLWYPRISFVRKRVIKFSFKLFVGCFCSIHRHGLHLDKVVGTHIVKTSNVIFVAMGKDNCIEFFDAFTKHLLPE